MKLLEFTDPHCTNAGEFSSPTDDGYTEYLQLFDKSFDFVCEKVLEEKPDILAFGGDFWDAQDYIDTASTNVGHKQFNKLNKLPVKYKLAVVGNHDYFDIENNIHTLEFLKGLGWHVFDKPEMIVLDGVRIFGLPYRDKYDLKELETLLEGGADIVLTHLDVVGAIRRAPKSDKDVKAFSEHGLLPTLFSRAKMVLNGHYHHPSQVAPNFMNVGSLTTRTFHDMGSPARGIAVYDTVTQEFKRHNNPHARKFVELLLESSEDVADLLDLPFEDTYAKIYYTSKVEAEVQAVRDIFAGTRLLPLSSHKEEGKVNPAFDVKFSLEDNLESYLKENYPDDEGVRKISTELLNEASTKHNSSSSRLALDFGKLEIRNFQSIRSLSLDLQRQGLVFLRGVNLDDKGQGSNGAGKSSVIEAIYWCLTGKSLRGYKSNDVIHWDEDHVRVSLDIHTPDTKYTVTRSRKDPELGTGVKLFIDDKSAGARLASDTDEKVEELIGRSHEQLQHTCFLTADMSSRFSSLGYSQRAQLLEEVIDSSPYRLAQELCTEKLRVVTKQVSQMRGTLEAVLSSKIDAESRFQSLKTELFQFDRSFKFKLENLETQIDFLRQDVNAKESKKLEWATSISEIQTKIQTIEEKFRAFHNKHSEDNNQLISLSSQQAVYDNDIYKFSSLQGKSACPTCEEQVDTAKVTSKISNFKAVRNSLDAKREEVAGRVKTIQTRIQTMTSTLRELNANKTACHSEISKLDQAIQNNLRTIEAHSKEQQGISTRRSSIEAAMKERESEIANLELKETSCSSEMEKLADLEADLSTVESSVFSERGVRNSLLSEVAVPYINSKLPEYCMYLMGGSKLELAASRQLKKGETRNDIDIIQEGRRTYTGNSSGERRRVDLPLQFAIGDLGAACGRPINFLVVDEVLDKLDEPGVYAALEVLKKVAQTRTVLMVSHLKYAASIAPKVLTLKKHLGETVISELTRKME